MIEELIEGKLIEKLGSYYWWRNKTNDLYGTDIEGNILVKIIRRGVNLYVYNRSTNKSFKYEFNKNEDLDAIMKILTWTQWKKKSTKDTLKTVISKHLIIQDT